MNTLNVQDTVLQRFVVIVGLPSQDVDLDADLVADYGLNSLKALKLLSDVEVEFDVDIAQDEARSIRTLNDVIGLINAKLS
jgi:acyl carrier protein